MTNELQKPFVVPIESLEQILKIMKTGGVKNFAVYPVSWDNGRYDVQYAANISFHTDKGFVSFLLRENRVSELLPVIEGMEMGRYK